MRRLLNEKAEQVRERGVASTSPEPSLPGRAWARFPDMPPKQKPRVLTHERFARTAPPDAAQLELTAIREILHALLNADRPEEVFQYALDRISPLIGASFASVYVVEGVSELMKLAAAYNWPPKYRPWLGEVRVRMGFGPSGEAAAERRIIEVPDVRTDKGLEDWAEVARELGFRSLVALPLQHARGALGAVTFYFAEEGVPTPERRNLMRLVAEQMAATAEKVRLVDDLRRTTAALSEASADLDVHVARGSGSVKERTRLLAAISAQLQEPLHRVIQDLGSLPDVDPNTAGDPVEAAIETLQQVTSRVDDIMELEAMRSGQVSVTVESFTGAELGASVEALLTERGVPHTMRWHPEQSAETRFQTDRRRSTRILATAIAMFSSPGSPRDVELSIEGPHLLATIVEGSRDLSREELGSLFDWIPEGAGRDNTGHPGLARALARLLGGELDVSSAPGQGITVTVRLPLVYLPGPLGDT